MKLLVEIDDQLFNRVKRLTGAKKKKDAIVIPMLEYVKAREREGLIDLIGNFDFDMTQSDLKRLRKQWKNS